MPMLAHTRTRCPAIVIGRPVVSATRPASAAASNRPIPVAQRRVVVPATTERAPAVRQAPAAEDNVRTGSIAPHLEHNQRVRRREWR